MLRLRLMLKACLPLKYMSISRVIELCFSIMDNTIGKTIDAPISFTSIIFNLTVHFFCSSHHTLQLFLKFLNHKNGLERHALNIMLKLSFRSVAILLNLGVKQQKIKMGFRECVVSCLLRFYRIRRLYIFFTTFCSKRLNHSKNAI